MALRFTLALLIFAAVCATVNAILPLSVAGSKFFTSDGNQFFIKGMHHARQMVRLNTR
jgi:hypothetical protein